MRENHEWHRVETDEVLLPMLAEYITTRNDPTWNEYTGLSRSGFEWDATPLLRNKRFESVLTWRLGRQSSTISESRILLEATNELIALINGEIGQ